MEAHYPDPELGYIVPRPEAPTCLREIHRFVEKPAMQEAQRLCEQGALWNSFIFACRAQSLIELYRARCPEIVCRLEAVCAGDYNTLDEVYRELPQVDFSRQIAAGQERYLSVLPVPRCGWTDLGTPLRLAQAAARHIKSGAGMPKASWSTPGDRINLAQRCMRGDATRDCPPQSAATQ
jgi:mannose-1-phosphate guanylyltransferase